MLHQFLAVQQSESVMHVRISPPFWTSFPLRPPLNRVLCAIRWVLPIQLFYTQQSVCVSPNLPILSTLPSPLGDHKFVLYMCDSIFALQISSSVPFIWRRQWHPTLGLLPGKSHGRRSLVGCSPWGREESDTTEQLHFHFSLSCIREGNGNPLQCSCLENPRDGGAWCTAVYGVAQSRR